jgi:8-oxo-dGTP pyrophosphatase MutT (NUDIX family)
VGDRAIDGNAWHSHAVGGVKGVNLVKDQSFGIIPVRMQDGRALYLLVQHHAGHWAFPKGHAEDSESDLDAARRELHEETGVADITVLDDAAFSESYFFKRNGLTVAKTVRYFLGLVKAKHPRVRIQAAEIKAYQWADFDAAMTLLTFSESKRLLSEANAYVQAHAAQLAASDAA